MSISNVLPVGYTYTPSTKGKSELGKEDFLMLMIQQLQNQDPLEPVGNEEYIAQLAQFNSLEQMQNLNKTMESLGNLQILSQTAALVGRNVQALNTNGATITGTISAIEYKDGVAKMVIRDANNTEYRATIDKILSLS
jgi:flagellar basal-body rod modification protein FlgD